MPATSKRGETIRSFICVEIPKSIQDRIEAVQNELKRADARVSWVKSSNTHLTIKFLGDVQASKIPRILESMTTSIAGIRPFEIEVGGTGAFPSARNPRILWIGLTHVPDRLQRIRDSLETELSGIGFERESKNFSPHLTLGRLRSPEGSKRLIDLLSATSFEPQKFEVTEVILMRSDLSPSGSVYHVQGKVPLQDPN